ncbi:LysE family translocator [Staphylococcus pettenkoferi]|uniref:LysE family translocator n=1 Tax=Staphylococcus pettenkoferi TaxID=170573 RepID=UPI00066D8F8C|nr:LysE family translocator [Staphylococcus pettenkoferi]MCY1567388.1 LysE family translocator [Staphylococcus pettenkoferi]MCY1588245.1 LysE family translocator [Staphylococcus pettenkoferi]MDK7115297.1 LysE family translocator [Staphylococcus pettenkoferi]MDK7283655.1 LysE family translocator [Staphylococcus pettenkoferi]
MEELGSFIIISLLIIIVPGPDFFIVMKNSISAGKRNGLTAATGIATGHLAYSLLAVCGLIVIVSKFHWLFVTVKLFGVAYLVYLGVRSIISARQSMNFSTRGIEQHETKYFTSFRQGFLSTTLNPKALLYYLSILPQFINTGEGLSLHILILLGSLIISIWVWFIFCVYVFQYIKRFFANRIFKAIFDYAVGFILIGLSIKLLIG